MLILFPFYRQIHLKTHPLDISTKIKLDVRHMFVNKPFWPNTKIDALTLLNTPEISPLKKSNVLFINNADYSNEW